MIQKTVGFRVKVNNNKAKQKQTKGELVKCGAQSLKSGALIGSWNTHHYMKSAQNKIPVAGIW